MSRALSALASPILALAVLTVLVPAALAVLAVEAPAVSADAGWASAQTVDPELLDDAGRIIGSPDAGPDPQHSGDRGGWAQYATLATMTAGIGFIAWRIRIALTRPR